jgi:hypothetical protein
MVGPARRANSWTFTKYKGGDVTGVFISGGEGGSGAVGPDSSLAAGAVGADGAVSPLGGEVAGVCPEASGEGGGTISGGGPGLLLNKKIKSRTMMTKPVPMKTPVTQEGSFPAVVIV